MDDTFTLQMLLVIGAPIAVLLLLGAAMALSHGTWRASWRRVLGRSQPRP
jgi:hypothetical protein